MITGCWNTANTNPKEAITAEMQHKYGIHVKIISMKKYPGLQMFQEPTWHAVCLDQDTGEEFDAYLEKSSGIITDDFPKIIYDKSIRNLINTEIESYPELSFSNFSINYQPSQGKWTKTTELMDYLSKSDTYIQLSVQRKNNQDAEQIFSFAKSLKEKGIHFHIQVEDAGHITFLVHDKYTSLDSRKEIVNRLNKK